MLIDVSLGVGTRQGTFCTTVGRIFNHHHHHHYKKISYKLSTAFSCTQQSCGTYRQFVMSHASTC